ncbi:MAG TPA: GvpL/GvpF family gas vesicle protein [Candidatus Angelobacter sp.]
MAWYAYCIVEQQAFQNGIRTRRPVPVEDLKGIGDAQTFAYPSGEFSVIVSEYMSTGDLGQKALLQHAHVVSECFKRTTVLPFRFGSVFDNDDALRRAVRLNRKAFVESVSRLKGKAEMHLKLLVKDGSLRQALEEIELPATVGSEYLSKLREKAVRQREHQTKARALSVQVHKIFDPLDQDVCCRKVDSGGMLIDIAHLIDHKKVEKYQNKYQTATRHLPGVEVVMSGPWPPYHFIPGKRTS